MYLNEKNNTLFEDDFILEVLFWRKANDENMLC